MPSTCAIWAVCPQRAGVRRERILVRADALWALTDNDVARLVDAVGIVHVIDLRTPQERAERGRGPLEAAGVEYSELMVFDEAALARRAAGRAAALDRGADPAQVMAEGYRSILELGAAAFVVAFERITGPGGAPVVVHCAAGKDRTGVLIALLLEVAGVERRAVIADDAATQLRMPRLLERLQAAGAFRHLAGEVPAFAYEARAATMASFLADLDATWGGPAAFLEHHGARPATLRRWREVFVDAAA